LQIISTHNTVKTRSYILGLLIYLFILKGIIFLGGGKGEKCIRNKTCKLNAKIAYECKIFNYTSFTK
jgi:hypothetical protein